MATLNVSVVSADREVWAGAANQVIAKTVEGEIGILRGHEPVLAILSEGEVRVTTEAGQRIVVVREVLLKRVGAPVAAKAIEDRTPPPPPKEERPTVPRRDRGAGRPTKRERRQIERLRGY